MKVYSPLPLLTIDILRYAAGYIDDSDEEDNSPTVYILALLLSAGAPKTTLSPLMTELNTLINDRIARNPMKKSIEPVRLENTVHMAAQRGTGSTLHLVGAKVDLDSVSGRKVESRVDVKKLEKVRPARPPRRWPQAERKIRAKWEKRANVAGRASYESSKLIDQSEQKAYEDFFMSVNPLQMGASARAKSRDIKIDAIDLFFAGNRLLTDANLTLAYGRRYGLVGNNGVGKSTLLRALSRREIAVPQHISILHVEQEVHRSPEESGMTP
jgi:ATP-binding cassette, subfamily F, member 3